MAEPGDLIKIYRGDFSHWALYIGEGYVIHITGDASAGEAVSGIFASLGSSGGISAIVKKERLKEVALGAQWVVDNFLDNQYTTKSEDVILKEAELLVGQKVPYNLLANNCEHFVTNLRYGIAESRQARTAMAASVGSVGVSGIFASLTSTTSSIAASRTRTEEN